MLYYKLGLEGRIRGPPPPPARYQGLGAGGNTAIFHTKDCQTKNL